MSVYAVIAARAGDDAKTRLCPVLDRPERDALVEAMLHDMIDLLKRCRSCDHVFVITPSPTLAEIATVAGAMVLLEPEAGGINAAFDTARRSIRAVDEHAVLLTLPGDLPLIAEAEAEVLLETFEADSVLIVPADDRRGTGAIVSTADAPFAFQFGEHSFRRHYTGAVAAGLRPIVMHAPGLAHDIDLPEDLDDVVRRAPTGRTARLIMRRRLPIEVRP